LVLGFEDALHSLSSMPFFALEALTPKSGRNNQGVWQTRSSGPI